jgi:hypothetical protein
MTHRHYGALAGAALLVTAGCSAAGGGSSAAAQPAALTCKQQYQAWRTGPANPDGQKLQRDAAAIASADDDIPVMASDLKAVGADAAALEAYPMPKCADPAGYWLQYLAAMKAAGDNAGTASGLGALLLAAVPLKQVPGIQDKLNAELAKTVGVKAPLPVVQSAVPVPTLATVPVPTLQPPPPLPTLATMAPVPTAGT